MRRRAQPGTYDTSPHPIANTASSAKSAAGRIPVAMKWQDVRANEPKGKYASADRETEESEMGQTRAMCVVPTKSMRSP
jgi:hypothetical protein